MRLRNLRTSIEPTRCLDMSTSRSNQWGGVPLVYYAFALLLILVYLGDTQVLQESLTLRGSSDSKDFVTTSITEETKLFDSQFTVEEKIVELEETQQTILDLKKQLEDSKAELSTIRKDELEAKTKLQQEGETKALSSLSSFFESNEVCSCLPSSGKVTVTHLWEKYLPEILDASRNELMPQELQTDEETEKFRKLLTETLSPARMRRAVRHMPTFSHRIVKNVMGIIEKRILDPANNPPLRIAVYGGSVTIGRDCQPKRMAFLDCAWPKRFELLVNQFFKSDIIKVYNLGVGGTATPVATRRVKYWMYTDPELMKVGPDVIINAYSTNDSLPPWGKKWPEDDFVFLVEERVRDQLQDFVRAALESKLCAVPPLVVHVDDYLGPQQPALLGELSYVSALTQIAKYYDTVGISYAEVVRDIVYQDQKDSTFAGIGDVHFGQYAHQTVAWSVAFASLQLLINYCDDESTARMAKTKNDNDHGNEDESNTAPITKEYLRDEKLFLPPPLTREMLLENAEAHFDAAVENAYKFYIENDCASLGSSGGVERDMNPCIVTWISTPGDFNARAIARFMDTHKTLNDGWQAERQNAEGWSNKDGWIASKPKATFALRFDNLSKPVNTVSIFFLRSYGEKWKDSRAKFTISRIAKGADGSDAAPSVVSEFEIAGVWDDLEYEYSMTLSETMTLSDRILEGEVLTLEVNLVSGTTFKIMGMMLCSS
mmetsp:Transcript_22466/g.53029  ORF Transcript_22466/g.53029 Transcript_22466/m.53029 type:complete len:716 (-) Transcript_22466:187-2334(-)